MKPRLRRPWTRSKRDASLPAAGTRHAAIAGLQTDPKRLPCSLFYDDVGAVLFEKICETPEYYPARTETAILSDNLASITQAIGAHVRLVELGSGGGAKTRILLRQLDALEYVPVDISRMQLLRTAQSVAREFLQTSVRPLCADYTRPLRLREPVPDVARTAFFFPGSTIGNFEPGDAEVFLRSLTILAGGQSGLLIGVDLHKSADRLDAAYNDAQGITAEFNRNVLRVLNRDARADFNLARFSHEASYDQTRRRIQMRLVSKCKQDVRFAAGLGMAEVTISFTAGEPIITEHSYKYTLDTFASLLDRAGWVRMHTWTDAEQLFAVHWCVSSA